MGESDFDAACRECFEEVGLDLKDKSKIVWLGRGPQQIVNNRKGAMRVIPHIFIDFSEYLVENKNEGDNSGRNNVEFVLQQEEVVYAWWMNLEEMMLDKNYHRFKTVVLRDKLSHGFSPMGKVLLWLFQVSRIHFPAVFVGDPLANALAAQVGIVHKEEDYYLWGLTLTMLRSILVLTNIGAAEARSGAVPRCPLFSANDIELDNVVLTTHLSMWLQLRALAINVCGTRFCPSFMLMTFLTAVSYATMWVVVGVGIWYLVHVHVLR